MKIYFLVVIQFDICPASLSLSTSYAQSAENKLHCSFAFRAYGMYIDTVTIKESKDGDCMELFTRHSIATAFIMGYKMAASDMAPITSMREIDL